MSRYNDKIRTSISASDTESARSLLREALRDNPDADTYYLAAQVAVNNEQRQKFLQQALDLDPFHSDAYAALNHTLSPSEAIQSISPDPATPTYILASIRSSCNLYQVPHSQSTIVARLNSQSQVIPLTRNEEKNWFNVLYLGTTGREITGWINSDDIKGAHIADRQVDLIELPITQYEFNSRAELENFSKLLNEEYMKIYRPYLGGVLLWMVGGIISGGIIFAISFNLWYIALIVYISCLMVGLISNQAKIKQMQELSKQAKFFKELKKTDAEKLLERQAKMMAMNAALQVGGTLLTRYVPNRSEVTIRRK